MYCVLASPPWSSSGRGDYGNGTAYPSSSCALKTRSQGCPRRRRHGHLPPPAVRTSTASTLLPRRSGPPLAMSDLPWTHRKRKKKMYTARKSLLHKKYKKKMYTARNKERTLQMIHLLMMHLSWSGVITLGLMSLLLEVKNQRRKALSSFTLPQKNTMKCSPITLLEN